MYSYLILNGVTILSLAVSGLLAIGSLNKSDVNISFSLVTVAFTKHVVFIY